MDRLFRAHGHEGIQEAGASRENRIAKKAGTKGKKFGDLFLPDCLLFEMKSARENARTLLRPDIRLLNPHRPEMRVRPPAIPPGTITHAFWEEFARSCGARLDEDRL
jgi:hypothetical protein